MIHITLKCNPAKKKKGTGVLGILLQFHAVSLHNLKVGVGCAIRRCTYLTGHIFQRNHKFLTPCTVNSAITLQKNLRTICSYSNVIVYGCASDILKYVWVQYRTLMLLHITNTIIKHTKNKNYIQAHAKCHKRVRSWPTYHVHVTMLSNKILKHQNDIFAI